MWSAPVPAAIETSVQLRAPRAEELRRSCAAIGESLHATPVNAGLSKEFNQCTDIRIRAARSLLKSERNLPITCDKNTVDPGSRILEGGEMHSSHSPVSLENLERLSRQSKSRGEKVALCHGTFDLTHVGHIRPLERASREGDVNLFKYITTLLE